MKHHLLIEKRANQQDNQLLMASSTLQIDKDNMKRVLDLLLRARESEQIEAGEKEALIDCIKCDLKFCQQYEEQMKILGFNVPKRKAEANPRQTIDSI